MSEDRKLLWNPIALLVVGVSGLAWTVIWIEGGNEPVSLLSMPLIAFVQYRLIVIGWGKK